MATGYRVPTGRANQVMEGVRIVVLFEDNYEERVLTIAPGRVAGDYLSDEDRARTYIEVPNGLGQL